MNLLCRETESSRGPDKVRDTSEYRADASVAPLASSDRNVGRFRLASPDAVGADDRAPRSPAQESHVHERIDDVAAIVDAEADEADGLGHRQFQARHLVEVGANPIHGK